MLEHLVAGIVDGAAAIALPSMVLALTVSGLIVLTGWSRRREWLRKQGQPRPADRFELSQTPFATGLLDVAAEARTVLQQCESLAARHFVALELAVHPELAVRADPRAFQEILGDLVARAIEHSPCGRVLLGAARTGGRVQISVSDDGPLASHQLRASQIRSAERLAALQGGTMEIDTPSGGGTTVILRMPATASGPRQTGRLERSDPASVWQSPQPTSENASSQ